MIELAQHIEVLLLENDCVIVPGLGGFIAHYNPAIRVEEENIFLPPTRVIGFNPQLKMNDGLLVQSYMSVYGTNFSDATKMVDRKVDELVAALHENGKVDLPNVGEVRYTIHSTFDFIPFNNKITTPYLYGLDIFEMQELAALKNSQEKMASFAVPVRKTKEKTTFKIEFKSSYLVNAAAVVAAVFLFFFFSTPIENTEVIDENYAQLLPEELFGKIEKQSLAITPIIVKQAGNVKDDSRKNNKSKKKEVLPISVKEVKVNASKPIVATDKTIVEASKEIEKSSQAVQSAASLVKQSYHIIIASVGTEKDAQAMAIQLVDKGYSSAKAIVGDGKMRVSIQSCTTEAEAYQEIAKLRQNDAYQNAWVLKK